MNRRGCYCSFCGSGRWPPKPPRDSRCDATIGWAPDSLGMPLLKRCGQPATETAMVSEAMHVQTYLCATHAHLGFRNPKKFPVQPAPVTDGGTTK